MAEVSELVFTDIKEETGNVNVKFYKTFYNGEEVDFVRIDCPGDKWNIIDTLATPVHKARYKTHWNAYVNQQKLTGTPIEEWTDQPEGMRREFKHFGFNYVEQVAGAPDSAFARLQGGTSWRVKAQRFLDSGKIDTETVMKKQEEEIKELKEKMALLMENMNKKEMNTPPEQNVEEPMSEEPKLKVDGRTTRHQKA